MVAPFREGDVVARPTAVTLVVKGGEEIVDYRGATAWCHVRADVEGGGKVNAEVQLLAAGEPTATEDKKNQKWWFELVFPRATGTWTSDVGGLILLMQCHPM